MRVMQMMCARAFWDGEFVCCILIRFFDVIGIP
jgi:hypothetical protein